MSRIWRQLCSCALVLLVTVHVTHGYSSGADPSACTSLSPNVAAHGSAAQTSDPPYAVVVSKTTYTAGETITVTLEGRCETFKGFLVVAKRADPGQNQNEFLGQFAVAPNTQRICNNGDATERGLTHSPKQTTLTKTLQWTAPTPAVGHVIFRATFVRDQTTFWVNVASDVVSDPSVTALSSSVLDSLVSATPAPTTCTTTPAPTLPSSASISRDSNCGNTLGCFDDCQASSASSCTFSVSWATSGNNIRFTLKTLSVGNSWMALGFSEDKTMGSDSVAECVIVNNVVAVYQSYNTDSKQNSRLTDPSAGVTLVSGSLTNGVFQCVFDRVTSGTADPQSFDLNQDWIVFLGTGEANPGGKSKHVDVPTSSATVVDFQSTSIYGAEELSFPLVKAHASLMTLAWILFTSIAIILPRFYKPMWPGRTIGGLQIWFQLHRGLMIGTLLFTVIAFILIFVEVKGYSQISGATYQKAHPVLGIIVTVLVIANPVMALFRPAPTANNRPIFNWAHFLVGRLALILAVVTIFFGASLSKARAPPYVTYILYAYVGWQLLVEIALEIVKCYVPGKEKIESINMDGPSQSEHRPNNTIYYVFLVLHAVVLLGLSLAVVGIIAAA